MNLNNSLFYFIELKVHASDGQRGQIATSVISRSKNRSSRKMPEFPSWMTFQNYFWRHGLCALLPFLRWDWPERGDTVFHPMAKLESHHICLMHKFMLFLLPEKVKYSLILKSTWRAANYNKIQAINTWLHILCSCSPSGSTEKQVL